MGVSLPGGGGGGRGRNLNAELNLVPFIDLLSVCITFLLATAVWTQLSTMQVDQEVSSDAPPPPTDEKPPPPPLTLHMRADGAWLGREIATGKNFPVLPERDPETGEQIYDWVAIEEAIGFDRDAFPDEESVVIVTDDGVTYRHTIKALDVTRALGLPKSLLGGGPASTNAEIAPAPPG